MSFEETLAQQTAKACAPMIAELVKIEVERQRTEPLPFVSLTRLMSELDCSYKFIKKLEDAGIKRIQIQDGGKKIYYNRRQVEKVLDSLAI